MLFTKKRQNSMQVRLFFFIINIVCIRFTIVNALSHIVYFISDLPKDSKIFDMDKVINFDLTKLKAEETGERIVRKIQEWLISETSAGERAALPEDITQHLLIGVSVIPSNLP